MPGGEPSSSYLFHLEGRLVELVAWWLGCRLAPGSLAGLVDVLVDVLGRGQLGNTRLGLVVGHLGSSWGEVLITLCNHSRHNHRGPRWTAADVLLAVIFLRWFWSRSWLVLLHYPHTACLYCREMTAFGFDFLLRRR